MVTIDVATGDRGPVDLDWRMCLVCASLLGASSTNSSSPLCAACTAQIEESIDVRIVRTRRGSRNRDINSGAHRSARGLIVVTALNSFRCIRIEFDLFRTEWALRRDVVERLVRIWRIEEKPHLTAYWRTRGWKMREMRCGFGPSVCRFDVAPDRADYWSNILRQVLRSKSARIRV